MLLLLLISSSLVAKNDIWYAFEDNKTGLLGYKDKNDIVKIKAKYMGLTNSDKFENIMAVMEDKNASLSTYYLTKSGKIVGREKLHIYDNGADCESEGFIRFMDNDKVGMFNSDGEVVIPAGYSYLSRVQNGLIHVLKHASKKHSKHTICNHLSWDGGSEALIDTSGNFLVKDFKYSYGLNFYSLKISDLPSKNKDIESFKGVNGRYYLFQNYKKEFKSFVYDVLIQNLGDDELLKNTYANVTYWKKDIGWTSLKKEEFFKNNYTLIKNALDELKKDDVDYSIFIDGLNPYIYSPKRYGKYFDNCLDAKEGQYPLLEIVITYKVKNDYLQNHFGFLRTDEGYKLIEVSLKKDELK